MSNIVFSNCLRSSGRTGVIASEEEDEPVFVEETYSGNYVVVFDPLDGSSNIDAGISVGMFFAVCVCVHVGVCLCMLGAYAYTSSAYTHAHTQHMHVHANMSPPIPLPIHPPIPPPLFHLQVPSLASTPPVRSAQWRTWMTPRA